MIPMFRNVVAFFGGDFTVLDMSVAHDGANETLRVRADFSHPIFIVNQFIYPLQGKGWMQVNLTLGGVLQYSLFLLIVVVAWPVTRASEYLLRLALSAPLILILLLIDVPPTILANLWFPVHDDLAPHALWPLLIWSRFLMGGGGLVVAFLFAAAIVVAARTRTNLKIGEAWFVSRSA
jgi:hypothetical protein